MSDPVRPEAEAIERLIQLGEDVRCAERLTIADAIIQRDTGEFPTDYAAHVHERTRATDEWREATDAEFLMPILRAYAASLRQQSQAPEDEIWTQCTECKAIWRRHEAHAYNCSKAEKGSPR